MSAVMGVIPTDTFVATRSVTVLQPGHEPTYHLSFELDDDAGVDYSALLGDRLPDLF